MNEKQFIELVRVTRLNLEKIEKAMPDIFGYGEWLPSFCLNDKILVMRHCNWRLAALLNLLFDQRKKLQTKGEK